MRGRPTALASLAVLLILAEAAHAHRLEAEYRVLPERKVRVECWFDLSGDSAKGAAVQVFADGQQIAEGKLDEKGVFVFTCAEAKPLTVVIDAGMGHRRTLTIPATALTGVPASADHAGHAAGPSADRSPRVTFTDVLAGLGFLLAVAAFFLSLRNARQVRDLNRMREGKSAEPRP